MRLSIENVARVVRILEPRIHAAVRPLVGREIEVRLLGAIPLEDSREFGRSLHAIFAGGGPNRIRIDFAGPEPKHDLRMLAQHVVRGEAGSANVLADALIESGILRPIIEKTEDINRLVTEWALDTIWTPTRLQLALFVENSFATMGVVPMHQPLSSFARIEFTWPEASLSQIRHVDKMVRVRVVSLHQETHREHYYVESMEATRTRGHQMVRVRLSSVAGLDFGSEPPSHISPRRAGDLFL